MRAFAAAVGFGLVAAVFPASALAHGGTYQGPGSSKGPGFQVPPDVAVRNVKRPSISGPCPWSRRHLKNRTASQRSNLCANPAESDTAWESDRFSAGGWTMHARFRRGTDETWHVNATTRRFALQAQCLETLDRRSGARV